MQDSTPATPDVLVTATEQDDGSLLFELTVAGGSVADIRGLFFDVNNRDLVAKLQVAGDDVTDQAFEDDSVSNLGRGVNMKGTGVDFDAGVMFGTAGIGGDDIQSTSFTLSQTDGGSLTLDEIAQVDFGVRLTSVGESGGRRNDSLKLTTRSTSAPDAVDDVIETDEDNLNSTVNLLGNDTDLDSDTLTVIEVNGDAANVGNAIPFELEAPDTGMTADARLTVLEDGSASLDPNGRFEFLALGESATGSFTYRVFDNNGGFDTATVNVTIEGVNDRPIADDVAISVDEDDASVTGSFAATDLDATDALSFEFVSDLGPNSGSAINNGDGTFTFSPLDDFQDLAGDESREVALQFVAIDDSGALNDTSDPATVTVTVNGENDQPIAKNISFSIDEDDPATIRSFVGDDADATDVLSFVISRGPSRGSVVNNNDGTFTFDPGDDFQYLDADDMAEVTFQYVAMDDSGAPDDTSDLATVTVTVNGAFDAPVETTDILTFNASDQSMWGAGDAEEPTVSLPFIGPQWNVPVDVTLFPGITIGEGDDVEIIPSVTVTGETRGKIGLQPFFEFTTNGEVDATLRGELAFVVPKQVIPGQEITIQSGLILEDGSFFQTSSPDIKLGMDFVFEFMANASVNVGSLGSFDLISPAIDESKSENLFTHTPDDGAIDIKIPPIGAVATFTGFLPQIDTSSDSNSSSDDFLKSSGDSGDDPFLSGVLDLDKLATTVLGLPSFEKSLKGGIEDVFELDFRYNLLDTELAADLTMLQDFELTLGALGGVLTLENGTVLPSFKIGDDITFTVPDGFDTDGDEVLDFTALVSVNGDPGNDANGARLENLTNWNLDLSFALEILSGHFSGEILGFDLGSVAFGPVFEDSFPVTRIEPFATLFDDEFALVGFNTDTGSFGIDTSLENLLVA